MHRTAQPLNLEVQYYHDLSHPDRAGSEEVRFSIAALWPTAAAEAARKKEIAEAKAKKKSD